MRIRVPGLPFNFDMNGWMLGGMALAALGMMGAGVGLIGGLGPRSPLNEVFLGVAILGMALYFAGRVVQLVGFLRRKSKPPEPAGGEEP